MKIRQSTAIVFSGLLWMVVGISLLFKGFSLLLHHPVGEVGLVIPSLVAQLGQVEQVSLGLISVGLMIGFIKGRWVLAKTAKCVTQRILSLPNLCPISSIYSRSYLIMLSSMILLGVSMKWLAIPYDVKGVIDIAIGSALTNGAALYFRHFAEAKNKV